MAEVAEDVRRIGVLAKQWGVSRRFLLKRVAAGEIRAYRPSRRMTLLHAGDVARMMENYAVRPAAEKAAERATA